MTLPDLSPGLSRSPFFLIAGPCVVEGRELALESASALVELTARLGIPFVYKSSFDKANRTSGGSYRGPGRDEGLAILEEVRRRTGAPVLTDVHTESDVDAASQVVDYLQIPAFLCRQTDLVQHAAGSGLPVNIKKGQFLSPAEMSHVVDKALAANPEAVITVCERGSSFGYNNLVVDMRSLEIMRGTGCAVVFDCTHSVQLPGGGGDRSSGQRQFVPVLARAAVAAGISGLFMETHPDPDKALSDGPNAWPLKRMTWLLESLLALDAVVKSPGRLDTGS
ncbi:MAG: 3-deoxy-8-phosphooctulonate synthase [Proteobacteria bacterium]|nr:MAG: 3-deoxy-8-phosphooctulonate synthase [Pseudomonadota bacterium]